MSLKYEFKLKQLFTVDLLNFLYAIINYEKSFNKKDVNDMMSNLYGSLDKSKEDVIQIIKAVGFLGTDNDYEITGFTFTIDYKSRIGEKNKKG